MVMPPPGPRPSTPEEELETFYQQNPGLRPGASPTAWAIGTAITGKPTAPLIPGVAGKPGPVGAPGQNPGEPIPPLPPGFVPSPTPGRDVSLNGFVVVELNPNTNTWETGRFPPSAAEKAAALGTGTAGGINYATQQRPSDRTREDLIAAGGRQVGSNTIIMPGTWDKYTLGNNGYYGPFGRASRDDVQALMRAAAPGAQQPSAQPGSSQPGATRPGDLSVLNPVQGNQAPLLSSFKDFTTPGREISAEGLRPMYTGSGLNTLSTRALNPGGPTFGVTGIKPTASGNNYNFTPQSVLPA